eukprot:COSAG01_NODE_18139_length_1098_cov_0.768769_2_plen_87_part_00
MSESNMKIKQSLVFVFKKLNYEELRSPNILINLTSFLPPFFAGVLFPESCSYSLRSKISPAQVTECPDRGAKLLQIQLFVGVYPRP